MDEPLSNFTVVSRYALQEVDAIKENIFKQYKGKLNATLAKDIE